MAATSRTSSSRAHASRGVKRRHGVGRGAAGELDDENARTVVLDQRAAFDSVYGERRDFDGEGVERVGRLADLRAAAPEQPQAAAAIAIAGIASAMPDASADANFGLAVADPAEISRSARARRRRRSRRPRRPRA